MPVVKSITKQPKTWSLRVAGLFLLAGVTQSASAEDLWDIYQLALKNDAEYTAAAENFEAAKINLPLAKTAFRPTVSTSATLGQQRSDFTGDAVTSDNNSLNVNFGLPLYDKAQRIGISQAELQVESDRLQFEAAGDELTLRVAERYFNLLSARDNKEVARLQKVAIKRQMDLATERLDVGLGTKTDLFDAKARFERAKADEIAADIAINNAIRELTETTGQMPQNIASLSANSPLESPEPNDLKHWTNLAEKDNLNVRAEQLSVLIADKEVDQQRVARRPTLSLDANQRWVDSGPTVTSNGRNSTSSVGLTLNFPLYTGGSIKLSTEQAARQLSAAEQVLKQLRRNAATQTTAAFLDVTSGISEVEALAEAVVSGENALEAREEGFSAGLTTNLDVLDAQRDLSQTRTDFLQAKYNYILALLRLESAIGNLGDEDIQYINEWLE